MGWSFAVQYTQQAQVFRNSHGPAVLQSWQTLTLVGFKGHPHCFIMQNIKYSQTIWWLYFSESSSWVLRVGYFLENLPKKKNKKTYHLTWPGLGLAPNKEWLASTGDSAHFWNKLKWPLEELHPWGVITLRTKTPGEFTRRQRIKVTMNKAFHAVFLVVCLIMHMGTF